MDARMRESSFTFPSSIGTLKSTRISTFLPATSASRTVSFSMVRASIGGGRCPRSGSSRNWFGVSCCGAVLLSGGSGDGQPRRNEGDQVGDTAAVAPLVVVPRDDLHEVAAERHGRRGVDDRGAGVAAEVGRDEGLVADAEDALEAVGRGIAERGVELVCGGGPLELGREVDHAYGGRR